MANAIAQEAAGHPMEFHKGNDDKDIWTEVEPETVELLEKYFEVETQAKVAAKPQEVAAKPDPVVQRAVIEAKPNPVVQRAIIVDLTWPRWFPSRKAAVFYVREYLRLG